MLSEVETILLLELFCVCFDVLLSRKQSFQRKDLDVMDSESPVTNRLSVARTKMTPEGWSRV